MVVLWRRDAGVLIGIVVLMKGGLNCVYWKTAFWISFDDSDFIEALCFRINALKHTREIEKKIQ